jgi:hypothetical protein
VFYGSRTRGGRKLNSEFFVIRGQFFERRAAIRISLPLALGNQLTGASLNPFSLSTFQL